MAERRNALIIATYQYEDTELRQLVSPAHDAEALSRVLEDPVIGGFNVKILLNKPSYDVKLEIETFFSDRRRDELLLLYFTGHGIKDEDGKLYFSTKDTKRKLIRATAVEANFVNEVMQRSRSRRQVLLLDCCYSGAFARGMVGKADRAIGTKERFDGIGRVVLTASDAMQYSFEGDQVDGKGEPSVFTSTIVHGLKSGEADLDGDGHISLDELYDYVHDRVIDKTPEQRPGKWNFGVQGQIIIARNPNPVVKRVELPNELQDAMESPLAEVRKGAVRELGRLIHGKNKGLALSAHEALTLMKDDDSQKVKIEVDKILEKYENVQSVKETRHESKPVVPETVKTESTSIAEDETESLIKNTKQEEKEVDKKQPPKEQEVKKPGTPAKKSKLIWLLPSILIPFIGGMVVLGIYLNKPQKPVLLPEIIKPESSKVETVTQASVPDEEVFEKPDTPEDSLSEKTEDFKPSTKTKKPEQIVIETVKEIDVPEREIIEQPAISKTKFRSAQVGLSLSDVKVMLKRYNFYCKEYDWNKEYSNSNGDGFQNKFNEQVKNGDKVILDCASGLMWQQSGSDKYMTFKEAKDYVSQLQYAGHSDWRLPTLEEAMSLMESEENSDNLNIDSKFDSRQKWIWTSDLYSASSAWVVSFGNGNCGYGDFYYGGYYVRAVR